MIKFLRKMYRRTHRVVRNFYYYFWFVWNDVDWDYNGLYELLSIKFKKQSAFLASNRAMTESAPKYAVKLRRLAIACDEVSGKSAINYRKWDCRNPECGLYHIYSHFGCRVPSHVTIIREEQGIKARIDFITKEIRRHSLEWWD